MGHGGKYWRYVLLKSFDDVCTSISVVGCILDSSTVTSPDALPYNGDKMNIAHSERLAFVLGGKLWLTTQSDEAINQPFITLGSYWQGPRKEDLVDGRRFRTKVVQREALDGLEAPTEGTTKHRGPVTHCVVVFCIKIPGSQKRSRSEMKPEACVLRKRLQGIQDRKESFKIAGIDLDVAILSKEHRSVCILPFGNPFCH